MQLSRLFLIVAAVTGLPAQQAMPIRDASTRIPPTYGPLHEGRQVVMTGVVAGPAIPLRGYSHAVLQDEEGNGITLEGSREQLARLAPGDRMEVRGVIGNRGGLPVLLPESMRKLGATTPPAPQPMTVRQLVEFGNLGRYVVVESQVLAAGDNAGGDVLMIGDSDVNLNVFLPREQRAKDAGLRQFHPGDRVRVTGLSSQYSPLQPHDRHFQVLIGSESDVVILSRAWPISPGVFAYAAVGIAVACVLWWKREARLARQRRMLQSVMRVSEDVIGASSPREIVRRLQSDLPRAIGADDVEVFLYSRPANTLDRISSDAAPQPLSIPVEEPIGSFYSTVALCFRNRALLHVPDTRRSPIMTGRDNPVPASAVFVPMNAQREPLGVLAVYHRKTSSRANPERHAALQHLANQVATSLKLQEQQHMREQLLRSEKMAAAGQLISGVATDLRAPLESIAKSARRLLESSADGRPELREIASDAERGLEIVGHLVSFARMERSESKPLDLCALVNGLLDIRQEDRERKGVVCENTIPISPLEVLADQAQLEQALLTMIVHAEHVAASAPDRTLRVGSRVMGRKVLISIECAAQAATDPFKELGQGDYFGFPVAQAIAQSHGGDMRYNPTAAAFRLEFEMPVYTAPGGEKPNQAPAPSRPLRVLTALIVEPDTAAQRKLLAMLAARGHRAIPVATAEDAADFVQRMPFDVVFCSVRLHGLNWVELFQRVRRRVGAFALMTEGYDADSARAFRGGEGQVLAKPVGDCELDAFLGLVEVRQAASRR